MRNKEEFFLDGGNGRLFKCMRLRPPARENQPPPPTPADQLFPPGSVLCQTNGARWTRTWKRGMQSGSKPVCCVLAAPRAAHGFVACAMHRTTCALWFVNDFLRHNKMLMFLLSSTSPPFLHSHTPVFVGNCRGPATEIAPCIP
jgi:hypothetical protein